MYRCLLQWRRQSHTQMHNHSNVRVQSGLMCYKEMTHCVHNNLGFLSWREMLHLSKATQVQTSATLHTVTRSSNPSKHTWKEKLLPASTSVQRQLKCWAWLTSHLLSAAFPLLGEGNSHLFPFLKTEVNFFFTLNHLYYCGVEAFCLS